MDEGHRELADGARSLIVSGRCEPTRFREMLTSIPPAARDAWVDRVLGLGVPPDDGPELPRGCVPYLPCPVDALLRFADHAPVRAGDRFVDIGAGVGRAAVLVHLLTGAGSVGIEVQPALVSAARQLARRLQLSQVSFLEADAADRPAALTEGSVFLLYCPFSGERLDHLLLTLETVARARPIRVGCVDLPLPPCPWLELTPPLSVDLAIYRSPPHTRAPPGPSSSG